MLVAAGCGGALQPDRERAPGDDLCRRATEHARSCLPDRNVSQPDDCDRDQAREILDTSCDELASSRALKSDSICEPLMWWTCDDDEERLVAFPTYAKRDAGGGLTVPVHAWTFEPERDSSVRDFLIDSMEEFVDFEGPEQRERFDRRIRRFLFDNESGKEVELKVAGEPYEVGETEGDGRVYRRVDLSSDVARRALRGRTGGQWLEATVAAGFGSIDDRIPVIEPSGLMVVSDIDDTVKNSKVLDRGAMLRKTFLEEYRPVEGMAELYRRIDEEFDPAFYYLSASPWQLLPYFDRFLEASEFPAGPIHLRALQVADITSVIDFIDGSADYKNASFDELLSDFPDRDFLLVGDSTQHDPEVYGRLARQHPDQIRAIWIRKVEGADNTDARFEEAFAEVPSDTWQVFEEPSALEVEQLAPSDE